MVRKRTLSATETEVEPADGAAAKPKRSRLVGRGRKEDRGAIVTTNVPKREDKDELVDVDPFKNKEKVLIIASRGISFRDRHLMEDVVLLLPHCKKDAKVERQRSRERGQLFNEMAELKGCSSCLFFEGRKKRDLYLWAGKTPHGPSAKFLVTSIHTTAELKLTGNHLRGSRPILTFSPSFDSAPHLQLLKELLTQIFSTPKDHRKSKPFVDHVLAFSFLDNHIWFRNYQITIPAEAAARKATEVISAVDMEKLTLIEVGPRFCLELIKIFNGSFSGLAIYDNPLFVSPNSIRARAKASKGVRYSMKLKAKSRRKQHLSVNRPLQDEFGDMWRTSE